MDLVHGKMTLYGLQGTYWHPHNPYQPFYHFVAGLFGLATNGDILGSRFLNVLLALCCALAIYFLGRRSLGRAPSLFACLMFLTYDQSIVHFRMTYAHNMVGLGVLLMTLFLLRPAGIGNDLKAGLGLGLAAGAHPLFIHAAISGSLCRIKRWKSWFLLLGPAAVMIGFSLALAFFTNKQWLFDDLNLLKFTFTSRGESDGSGAKAFDNLWFFMRQDWFHAAIAFGLIVSARRRLYPILLVGAFVIFMQVKNRQNLPLFYYQALVILPTLCLAWASILIFFRGWLKRKNVLHPEVRRFTTSALFVLPAIAILQQLPLSLDGRIFSRAQYWATQSTEEVEDVARWLNERTTEKDFVACGYTLAWLLKARTANYLQIVTWYGYPTQGYDFGNKRERFLYDVSLENARYAVVGDNEQKWAFGEPNVSELVKKLQEGKWPIVLKSKNYVVLENPANSSSMQSPFKSINQTELNR
ncbi:MAG: glycosyltransferase family 39 protein [Terrimicrobiaceae bacterium]